jgi:hypothetical protein
MAFPAAHIGHQTAERIRIRIPSRKGDGPYFAKVGKVLLKDALADSLAVNPVTGSVLLKGAQVDVNAVVRAGEKNGLFSLKAQSHKVEPLSKRIVAPLRDVDRSVNRFSGGELDLPGIAFLTLLGVGLYQLARGNFRAPPWYTALWYAMGIFTKAIVDKR